MPQVPRSLVCSMTKLRGVVNAMNKDLDHMQVRSTTPMDFKVVSIDSGMPAVEDGNLTKSCPSFMLQNLAQ